MQGLKLNYIEIIYGFDSHHFYGGCYFEQLCISENRYNIKISSLRNPSYRQNG